MKRLRFKFWLSLVLFAGLARHAWGQARYMPRYEEPRWFTFRLSQVSAGAYAEANYQESKWEDSDTKYKYLRTFIGPALSLSGNGSVYHPNLLRYTLLTDGAFGWSRDKSTGGINDSTLDEFTYLGILALNVDLLASKPYNASGFLDYNHSYRDNDFYSRVLVESWRYGGRARYNEGPWSFIAAYNHRNEDSTSRYPVRFLGPSGQVVVTDDSQQSTIDEDTVNFSGRHTRLHGETGLDYYLNDYTRSDYAQTGTGRDQSVTLNDAEDLGGLDRYRLNTSATWTRRDNTFEINDEVLALASFAAEHRENLHSYYDFSYDHFSGDNYLSDSFYGQASVSHRLYESLTSSALVHASDVENSSFGNDGYSRTFGGGITEDYSKYLSLEHRMNLSASVFLDHTDQESIGVVENERHQTGGEPGTPEPNSFYLNQPNVDPLSIIITDQRDAPPFYVPGFDYEISQLGSRTLITWLRPPGPTTPAVVLVDYRSAPVPAGSYDTFTQNYFLRFEFWRNLLGAYSRVSLSDNNAPSDMFIQEYFTYTVGADLNWKGFRTGGEFQYYDGTDTDYRTIRLFQGYAFRPDSQSSLSFDFNEMWIRYLDLDRREEAYSFMARYYRTLTQRLALSVEAGTSYLSSQDNDQLLATFRPALRYWIGKTSVEAGYFYQYELFLNQEERQKHMFNVRLRRFF